LTTGAAKPAGRFLASCWRWDRRGTQLGRFNLTCGSLVILGLSLHENPPGRFYPLMPAGVVLDDKGGVLRCPKTGKPSYRAFAKFIDADARERFRERVLAALRELGVECGN
jgi:hypothetical protein